MVGEASAFGRHGESGRDDAGYPVRGRPSVLNAAISLLTVLLLAASARAGEDRPNVVIVMMDDVGFADLGAYGSEVETPTIDRLAENGPL